MSGLKTTSGIDPAPSWDPKVSQFIPTNIPGGRLEANTVGGCGPKLSTTFTITAWASHPGPSAAAAARNLASSSRAPSLMLSRNKEPLTELSWAPADTSWPSTRKSAGLIMELLPRQSWWYHWPAPGTSQLASIKLMNPTGEGKKDLSGITWSRRHGLAGPGSGIKGNWYIKGGGWLVQKGRGGAETGRKNRRTTHSGQSREEHWAWWKDWWCLNLHPPAPFLRPKGMTWLIAHDSGVGGTMLTEYNSCSQNTI